MATLEILFKCALTSMREKIVRPTGTTAFAYMYTGLWQSTAFYKIVILYGHPLQRLIVILKKIIYLLLKALPSIKNFLKSFGSHVFSLV